MTWEKGIKFPWIFDPSGNGNQGYIPRECMNRKHEGGPTPRFHLCPFFSALSSANKYTLVFDESSRTVERNVIGGYSPSYRATSPPLANLGFLRSSSSSFSSSLPRRNPLSFISPLRLRVHMLMYSPRRWKKPEIVACPFFPFLFVIGNPAAPGSSFGSPQ